MKTDTTETAKEEKEEESPMPKADAEKWKKEILEINDKRTLEYIQNLCSARLDLGRADFKLNETVKNATKAGKSAGEVCQPDSWYSNKNIKLKPLNLPTEKENYDEVGA